ncbi:hypothetical protein HME9304_01523 [Flagellimonas maritima]|uniref:DoxX family protein n=1 Tax=Flagellimonas maritima TaxID=1383885 RepID=A0A2Z4LS48_9FLAO|nr:DoxX family protein [Allomuricauda aurantiaca]AWX44520.1 hypothetical protein HME9304_01523 [Allomuricauda aurantiaca]
MENLTTHAVQILLFLFLAITFLQSGIDKIIDWKGNLGWLTDHFSKTFFKGMVPLLLGTILLFEMISGILSLIGAFQFFMEGESQLGFYGAILSALSLLMLLFGQRIAKDYEGAKTIVIYFIPTIFLIYLLQ